MIGRHWSRMETSQFVAGTSQRSTVHSDWWIIVDDSGSRHRGKLYDEKMYHEMVAPAGLNIQ